MRWQSIGLNVALVAAALLAVVLLYAWINQIGSPTIDPVRASNPLGLSGDRIQVEVRNGCGVDGVAGSVRNFFMEHGLDVVQSGNYDTFEESYTRVIDRTGEKEHAVRIAALLGVPASRVVQQVDPGLFLDVTVIVGKDYDTLSPYKK